MSVREPPQLTRWQYSSHPDTNETIDTWLIVV